jgi:hypothetical protein
MNSEAPFADGGGSRSSTSRFPQEPRPAHLREGEGDTIVTISTDDEEEQRRSTAEQARADAPTFKRKGSLECSASKLPTPVMLTPQGSRMAA